MMAADRSAALALFVANECRQFRASLLTLAAQLDHEFPGTDPTEFERGVALGIRMVVADITADRGADRLQGEAL
jgi:hypothetical protein